jgi:hypothetical protein
MEFITDPSNEDLLEFALRSGATYDRETGYFYTEGIDLVRFADLVRSQFEYRMEEEYRSERDWIDSHEPSEATEWADFDSDC